ncbi:MAG: ribosome biogenesis GTPase YlqF [cyanobacterium endosymbiont of Rhopalodia musculus]|uniref:ribosome biogenesis GTPase YlqF n=1 Tax=cyanobacterium endosymbiont of Epithemia clementina EcSB TaxID=3034674 RepID=UPI0024807CC6|nr:ribosome biogenesis GTPase YlqF [cyanobacterium endosymbiont of Epithemia clementina EcSB]WGT66793.1 ribosome biogenesis GTPase YlqF [cyanobacterium endosymbiont of Epithemia clementina EcSB]
MSKIQWYPGHIYKAERQLKEQLNKVDVVLEVLDARIPLASHHPQVPQWIGEKPRILVLNRVDMIPEFVRQQWITWFENHGETPYFTNAKQGKGVKALHKATQTAGVAMNRRRRDRGMLPRPVRAVVIGLPNVGKSALINRLLGRKIVASARRVGVTRQVRWVRISDTIELLDAPGVIPGNLENQKDAVKLAICEDIGKAAYDNQEVAGMLVDFLVELNFEEILRSRYHLDILDMTGEEYIQTIGYERYQGDVERASRQLLDDFRKGLMGCIPLELPPMK